MQCWTEAGDTVVFSNLYIGGQKVQNLYLGGQRVKRVYREGVIVYDIDGGGPYNTRYITVVELTESYTPTEYIHYLDTLTDLNTLLSHDAYIIDGLYSVHFGEKWCKDHQMSQFTSNVLAYKTKLAEVEFPEFVTYITSNAMKGCTKLKTAVIHGDLTVINAELFSGCSSLETVNIPDTVTSIITAAFYGCSALPSIYIPASVTTIGGSYVFRGCDHLTQITIDKPYGSIAGSPWGAVNATVTWTG